MVNIEQVKKHKPGVEVLEDKVIITIGEEIEHPMTEAHLIDNVMILKDTPAGWLKVKEIILNYTDKPQLELSKDEFGSGKFKVQSRCNLHGTWETEFEI